MATPEQLRAAGFSDEEILADAGFSPEEIASQIGKQAQPEMVAHLSPMQQAARGVLNIVDMPTMGLADKAISGGGAVVQKLLGALSGEDTPPISDLYNTNIEKLQAASQDTPLATRAIGELGGLPLSVATSPLKALGTAPTALTRLAQALGVGGATGAVYGAGTSRPGEEVAGAKSGALTGAVTGGAFQAGSELLGALAPSLVEAGQAMQRKSIGTRGSDYAKSANRLGILTDATESEVETVTKRALNELLDSGELGASRNPAKVAKVAAQNEAEIEKQIGAVVREFDQTTKAEVKPTFDNARRLLEEGGIPGDKIDAYTSRLNEIESKIEANGNRLPYIQKQKVAVGKDWDPADGAKNEFTRALYRDLRETIESAVPQVKPLNQELQKYKIAAPIISRALGAHEGSDAISALFQALRTSGGVGVPALAGAYTGHPLLGLAAGTALTAARSPRGMSVIGQTLTEGTPYMQKLIEALSPETAAIAGVSAVRR